MSFSFKKRLAMMSEGRKIQLYIKKMIPDERGEIVVHIVTNWEKYGLPEAPTTDQAITFLLARNIDEVKSIHENSKDAKTLRLASNNLSQGKILNLSIPDGYTASQAMIVLRDINDSRKVDFIVLDVDSGDYVPINPRLVAQLLVTTAENMVVKQNEIEQSAQGH